MHEFDYGMSWQRIDDAMEEMYIPERKNRLPKDMQERFNIKWGKDKWNGERINPREIEDFIINELNIMRQNAGTNGTK